jgi:enoyl-CoA hydratase/carnithine racemase
MTTALRESTLQTIGLGSVLDIFKNGKLPANTPELVDKVFGDKKNRGCLIVSGANGIVGAGKSMQLGSRLQPYDITVIALDFPGVPDGLGKQYPGLIRAFGKAGANKIMENIIRLNYDGTQLPAQLKKYNPRFLLEAIPEILDIKKSHYETFRADYPEIEIRSVTSGFPSSQLGVGIAHPAFPHEINKIFEIVEKEPSAVTQLLWSLGLIPMPVSDDWSFVLDVLFCGLLLAATRYHHASNMPYWKIDKYIRKFVGPNPFRAHDAIGAKGANFLTWSCLHHCSKEYGELFNPTPEVVDHKDSGQNWYPLNHFRPLVDWSLEGDEEDEFKTWILGPLFQMTSLMLQENRSHLSHINAIGELCAQFRNGILAKIRSYGPDNVVNLVKKYHSLHPEAAKACWYPDVFKNMESPDWQQLYVNAEHDGTVGIITLSRESYNQDVNRELNSAIDWLKAEGIERVILTGDFHLSSQLVGADTSDFYEGLENEDAGFNIAHSWSKTARRLYEEFKFSVGFVNGKRCLGGMLELLMHCHYLVSDENANLGMPEVTLPVVPGMEGCHWPFRKTDKSNYPKLLKLLLEGRFVKAKDTVGWLTDYAGTMEETIQTAWKIASDGDHKITMRKVEEGALKDIPKDLSDIKEAGDPAIEAARKAIIATIQESLNCSLKDALTVQAKHCGGFMAGKECNKGKIGADFKKAMAV